MREQTRLTMKGSLGSGQEGTGVYAHPVEMTMAEMLEAQTTSEGAVTFLVRVTPRARREGIEGVAGGALRVRLAAPPLEGKANEALCRLLADRLKIARSAVRIRSGEHSRLKRVEVRGVTRDRVLQLAGASPQ